MPYNERGKVCSTRELRSLEWLNWVRAYCKYGPYPQAAPIRYYIGVYQLGQGVQWKGTDSEYESWVAGAIHMAGAAEMLCSGGLHSRLPSSLLDLPYVSIHFERLMRTVGVGMQMIHYGETCAAAMSRASRFKPEVLLDSVADTVKILIGGVPVNSREEAMFTATDIMTDRL